MIYSINLGMQSQSVTPNFRDSTGQIVKDSGILCALFNQQIIVATHYRITFILSGFGVHAIYVASILHD